MELQRKSSLGIPRQDSSLMDASQEKEGRDLRSSSRSEFLFSQMEYLPERVAPVSV